MKDIHIIQMKNQANVLLYVNKVILIMVNKNVLEIVQMNNTLNQMNKVKNVLMNAQ